jgi:tRNA modification GTPase
LLRDSNELAADLRRWLDLPLVEILKDGVRVVVAGPPNAGKSSLINAIAGDERAIVTDIAGTTRDSIEVPLAIEGLPVLLTDTAGLRKANDPVEAIGVERAAALVEAADVLVWLGEPDTAPEHPRLIKVHAQADRADRGRSPDGSLAVSSVTGEGTASLIHAVAACAKDLLLAEGAIALNRRQRQLIGEALDALEDASTGELAIVAEGYRRARFAFDRLTGRAGVEDVLDALFSRFCLGK